MQTPSPGRAAISAGTNRSTEAASLLDKVARRGVESDPPRLGAQGSRVPLWPLRLSRGARGLSVEVSTKVGRKSTTSPPSADVWPKQPRLR